LVIGGTAVVGGNTAGSVAVGASKLAVCIIPTNASGAGPACPALPAIRGGRDTAATNFTREKENEKDWAGRAEAEGKAEWELGSDGGVARRFGSS